jgi:hypothetical protein
MAPVFTQVVRQAYGQGKELIFQTGLYRLSYRLLHWRKESFVCPICHYAGPFIDQLTPDTIMGHSLCPQCRSVERHRLQYLVMKTLGAQIDFSRMSLLHFAPERVFRELFSKWFRHYTTADMARADVHYQIDLRALPLQTRASTASTRRMFWSTSKRMTARYRKFTAS